MLWAGQQISHSRCDSLIVIEEWAWVDRRGWVHSRGSVDSVTSCENLVGSSYWVYTRCETIVWYKIGGYNWELWFDNFSFYSINGGISWIRVGNWFFCCFFCCFFCSFFCCCFFFYISSGEQGVRTFEACEKGLEPYGFNWRSGEFCWYCWLYWIGERAIDKLFDLVFLNKSWVGVLECFDTCK